MTYGATGGGTAARLDVGSRRPQIPETMESLGQELARLQQAWSNLRTRLAPVVHDGPVNGAAGGSSPRAVGCVLGDSLRSMRDAVCDLAGEIERTVEGVEL